MKWVDRKLAEVLREVRFILRVEKPLKGEIEHIINHVVMDNIEMFDPYFYDYRNRLIEIYNNADVS